MRASCIVVLVLASLFACSDFVLCGPPSGGGAPAGGGGAAAPGAPTEHWLYKNDDGSFELDGTSGKAMYVWHNGVTYVDTLTYKGTVTLKDRYGRPVDAWYYDATGNGNSWWLAFGSTPIGVNSSGEDVYPLWYSFGNPTPTDFNRWLTMSGTTRIKLP